MMQRGGQLARSAKLAVGGFVVLAGFFKLGFIADLLSIPVTTGFLAGIAAHILISQAPQALGLEPGHGPLIAQAASLVARIHAANFWTLCLCLGTLIAMLVGERWSPRFPAALAALATASVATLMLGLQSRGVTTLGTIADPSLKLSLPAVTIDDFRSIAPLAIIITLVVMVQTAATTRSFPDTPSGPDVNRDFIGVGA
jgi:sulfate permease, SulP family